MYNKITKGVKKFIKILWNPKEFHERWISEKYFEIPWKIKGRSGELWNLQTQNSLNPIKFSSRYYISSMIHENCMTILKKVPKEIPIELRFLIEIPNEIPIEIPNKISNGIKWNPWWNF